MKHPLPADAADPLGAAQLRARVLRTWTESPARFREDANAEEDAVLAGYRDRLLIELLQNAADAAPTGGGSVLLRLEGDTLCCANTGSELTPVGLQALSTLRASAKRGVDGAIGRFGTGFAAVLTATDAPVVVSGAAAIGWSRERTVAAVRDVPALAAEVAARGGQVAILRLPFAVQAPPAPAGYDTEVRLPLRAGSDGAAAADGEALLLAFDPTILLLLSGIASLVIDTGRVRREHTVQRGPGTVTLDGHTWRRVQASAPLAPELARLGAAEQRELTQLTATALWPEGGWPTSAASVLHAPTPTDEPLSLPVLVSVDVPLEAHRRRTVPGPLRSAALAVAADAVAALAARIDGPEVLRLVPTGLPAGDVDAELCELVLARLRAHSPIPGLHTLDLGRASAAVTALLTDPADPVTTDLLPASWPVHSDALRLLGISTWATADVVELLGVTGRGRPASWWRAAWLALADAPDRDALAALPVPLAGGGYAAGPRGLLVLPDGAALPPGLGDRLQVADPDAVTPLLQSFGALEAGPRGLLEALRPMIEASYDENDTDLAEPVLALVLAGRIERGELPWLGDLALTDADGETAPAGELVLAGSALDLALRSDAPLGVCGPEWDATPREALLAVGVADALVIVRGEDAVAELDGGEEFLAVAGDLPDVAGVRDLDLLRWPDGLQLLGKLPVETHDYVRWWCAGAPVLGGLTPAEVRSADGDPLLVGLYDLAPVPLLPGVAQLIGVRRELPTQDDDLLDLLDRLGDPGRTVERAQLRALLIHVAGRLEHATPPLLVRAVDARGQLVCVPGSEAVLVDAPDLLPLVGLRPVVPSPAVLAARLSGLLGVPLAGELAAYPLTSASPLTVLDVDGHDVRVPWRVIDGEIHAQGPDGLGRAQAWLAGEWSDRHAYVARLRDGSDRLAGLEDDLG